MFWPASSASDVVESPLNPPLARFFHLEILTILRAFWLFITWPLANVI